MYLSPALVAVWLSLARSPVTCARYTHEPVPLAESKAHARTVFAAADTSSPCELTCTNIALNTSIAVFFAPNQLADTYAGQQGEVVSACRVEPENADDVATVLLAAKQAHCRFAIRSGGHSVLPGASIADGGITLSLKRIDHVEISDDRKTVSLGSGGQWTGVYRSLEKQGLAVVGGRAGTVGVGGLLLGGGMSYISHRHGFGLDTVISFEMVLPNGTITRVDESKPELYRIMKGAGLSNFGIVTSFEVEAVEAPKQGYWLSFSSHGWDHVPAVLAEAHTHLVEQEVDDLDAISLLLFAYNTEFRMPLMLVLQVHSDHPSAETTPRVFEGFNEIPTLAPSQPQMLSYADTLQLGVDLGPPNGKRADNGLTVFYPSKAAVADIAEIVRGYFEQIKDVEGLYVNGNFQPLYRNMIKQMSKRGGNSLPVDADDGPMWLLGLAANWDRPQDDDFMSGLMKQTFDAIEATTKKHNVYHPYKYFNYAAAWQVEDVWAGYKDAELERLRRLQREYDPDQVFVSGGLSGGSLKLNSKDAQAGASRQNIRDEL